MTKNVTILGATGSIGESTLKVIRSLKDEFKVAALVCQKNIIKLEEQIKEFHPARVGVADQDVLLSSAYQKLKKKYSFVDFYEGDLEILDLVKQPVDLLVSGIKGAAGLKPTLESLPFVKRVALANKESLVMAGPLFVEAVQKYGVELIPIDSEHNALFVLMHDLDHLEIEKVILTASGGSLLQVSLEELENISPGQALQHPTWEMGNKITIDSATLMNKGLEVIEAHYLFNLPYDKIEVIIHPESVVHAMIELIDGSLHAHLGKADMVFPILYSFKYPKRSKNKFGKLSLEQLGSLNFCPYDQDRFPALQICYSAGKQGGVAPVFLNASNEVAVGFFLREQIGFLDIVKVVEKTMEFQENIKSPKLEDIFKADQLARTRATEIIKGLL